MQSLRNLATSAEIRWKAAPGLVWQTWPDADEWVVFNPASGDLHLLSAAGAELLRILAAEAMDLAALVRLTSPAGSGVEGAEVRGHLASTLDAFDRAGLIEPVRP